MLIWCKMKMSIGEWTPAFSGEDFLGGFWEVMWGRKLYLWGLWGQNWVVWPSALMVIGDVHNYPAMHCFGIPSHTQSMIAYKIFNEYFWKFHKWLHCGILLTCPIEIATIASWVMIASLHIWFIQYNYYLQDRGRVYEGMCVQFAT